MPWACLRGKFPCGAMPLWEYERDGETVSVDPSGPLIVRVGGAVDLAVALRAFVDFINADRDSR